MAISRGMVVFGVLLVCLCFIRAAEATNDDFLEFESAIHTVNRGEGCRGSFSGTGEECRDDDSHPWLDDDADDTFKANQVSHISVSTSFDDSFIPDDDDDIPSPHVSNNNVIIMGH